MSDVDLPIWQHNHTFKKIHLLLQRHGSIYYLMSGMNLKIRALFLHVIHKKRNLGEKLGLIKLYYAGKTIVKRVSLMTTSEILVALKRGKLPG